MNDVAMMNLKTGELTNYRPEDVLLEIAKSDAVIELAQRTKDWPLLETAVEKKLDDQEDFVNWWRGNVGRPGGDRRSENHSSGSSLMVSEAVDKTGITQPQVSKWAKRLQKREEYRAALYGVAYRQAMGALLNNFRAQASGKKEWYTPGEYIELSREVMGAIDLDPASSAVAQETVKAAEYFTAERNGLKHPWHGRVFLNPPYAAQDVSLFVKKLIGECKEGRVDQAILLVNNCTDTAWFHEAAHASAAICFPLGRISFVNPDGDSTSPTQGQAFFYFGDKVEVFAELFGAYGLMLARP